MISINIMVYINPIDNSLKINHIYLNVFTDLKNMFFQINLTIATQLYNFNNTNYVYLLFTYPAILICVFTPRISFITIYKCM